MCYYDVDATQGKVYGEELMMLVELAIRILKETCFYVIGKEEKEDIPERHFSSVVTLADGHSNDMPDLPPCVEKSLLAFLLPMLLCCMLICLLFVSCHDCSMPHLRNALKLSAYELYT